MALGVDYAWLSKLSQLVKGMDDVQTLVSQKSLRTLFNLGWTDCKVDKSFPGRSMYYSPAGTHKRKLPLTLVHNQDVFHDQDAVYDYVLTRMNLFYNAPLSAKKPAQGMRHVIMVPVPGVVGKHVHMWPARILSDEEVHVYPSSASSSSSSSSSSLSLTVVLLAWGLQHVVCRVNPAGCRRITTEHLDEMKQTWLNRGLPRHPGQTLGRPMRHEQLSIDFLCGLVYAEALHALCPATVDLSAPIGTPSTAALEPEQLENVFPPSPSPSPTPDLDTLLAASPLAACSEDMRTMLCETLAFFEHHQGGDLKMLQGRLVIRGKRHPDFHIPTTPPTPPTTPRSLMETDQESDDGDSHMDVVTLAEACAAAWQDVVRQFAHPDRLQKCLGVGSMEWCWATLRKLADGGSGAPSASYVMQNLRFAQWTLKQALRELANLAHPPRTDPTAAAAHHDLLLYFVDILHWQAPHTPTLAEIEARLDDHAFSLPDVARRLDKAREDMAQRQQDLQALRNMTTSVCDRETRAFAQSRIQQLVLAQEQSQAFLESQARLLVYQEKLDALRRLDAQMHAAAAHHSVCASKELDHFYALWRQWMYDMAMRTTTHPMAILFDKVCVEHRVPPHHQERPQRFRTALEGVSAFLKAHPKKRILKGKHLHYLPLWNQASNTYRPELLRAHEATYLDTLRTTCETAAVSTASSPSAANTTVLAMHPACEDEDTFVSAKSWDAASAGFAMGLHAVDMVLNGRAKNALVICRPPGHHAGPNPLSDSLTMGYCLLNHVAGAALHAADTWGLTKVTVMDFDLHHGNGTQDILTRTPDAARFQFISIHSIDEYPFVTGHTSDFPHVVNLPLKGLVTPKKHRAQWPEVRRAIEAFEPELILVSAGYDAHINDPISDRGKLHARDFHDLVHMLQTLADKYCMGRMVIVLEGGYCCGPPPPASRRHAHHQADYLEHLGDCINATCEAMLK